MTVASPGMEVDVIVVGAGLVGLALTAALARSRLSVALTDRSPVGSPELPVDEGVWDNRVYAVSPGSAEFLRGIGAWQRLPCERLQPIETMRMRGDGGGAMEFSAYDLGERSLAWIVEERALRAALVPRVRGTVPPCLCLPSSHPSPGRPAGAEVGFADGPPWAHG